MNELLRPTKEFTSLAWTGLFIALVAFMMGLYNADLQLNEKGYYFTVLLFGMFSSITLQKTVRDQLEGISVTAIYKTLNVMCVGISALLMVVGLWNVETLELNEKGFFGISFLMVIFASIVTQKNVRDLNLFEANEKPFAYHEKSPVETDSLEQG